MLADMTDFEISVLKAVTMIPRGKVSTYKLLATYLKKPFSARAVGNALNKNRMLVKIPCHRIVCSNGSVGGYASGTNNKIDILRTEGVMIGVNGKVLNFEEKVFSFK